MDKVVPDVAQSIDFGCQLRSYKGYFLIAGLRKPRRSQRDGTSRCLESERFRRAVAEQHARCWPEILVSGPGERECRDVDLLRPARRT